MTKAQEETARDARKKQRRARSGTPGFGPGASPADGVKVQHAGFVLSRGQRSGVRMSFGGFNKEVERMNEESAERRRRAKAMAEAANAKNEDVTDAEMAASLGKGARAARAKSAASGKGGDGAKWIRETPPALEATRKRSGDDDNHERRKKKSKRCDTR